jgi:phosphohistidine phosphatase
MARAAMNGPDAGRKLIVMRHAKSAWPDVPDRNRPLAPRGRRDAPMMGGWLRGSGYRPDHVLCSTARRARQTWQLTQDGFGSAAPPVSFDDRVYTGQAGLLLDLIRAMSPNLGTVLIVGHDPAVPELALRLAAGGRPPRTGENSHAALDRMRGKFPTAAVAVFECDGPWDKLTPGTAGLICFVTPRDLKTRPGKA